MAYTYAFEKMTVWQNARQVVKQIYFVTKVFPKEELFGITSQIRRASISINCNLAEGSARLGDKDQNRFYEIAFGSAVEVVNLLIVSHDLEYLNQQDYGRLRQDMEQLTFQINRLVTRIPGVREPDSPYETHEPE